MGLVTRLNHSSALCPISPLSRPLQLIEHPPGGARFEPNASPICLYHKLSYNTIIRLRILPRPPWIWTTRKDRISSTCREPSVRTRRRGPTSTRYCAGSARHENTRYGASIRQDDCPLCPSRCFWTLADLGSIRYKGLLPVSTTKSKMRPVRTV